MVQNSGKTLCTDTFKPVNLPEPLRVEESASTGSPLSLIPRLEEHTEDTRRAGPQSRKVQGQALSGKGRGEEKVAIRNPRRQAVKSIEDRWRIDDEWWRTEPVSRLYYAVLLASGQRLVIYKDLINGQWYRQGC